MSTQSPYAYFWRVSKYFSPVVLFVLLFEWSFWNVGENIPFGLILKKMKNHGEEVLFLREYYDQGLYRFKYLGLSDSQVTLAVLGTSRTMQFRSYMFGVHQSDFYNGGGLIQHIRDLEEFLESREIVDNLEVVILGIEFWWLLDDFARTAEARKHYGGEIDRDDVYDSFAHLTMYQNFLRRVIGLDGGGHTITFSQLFSTIDSAGEAQPKSYGWLARRTGTGFRKDGSFNYGAQFVTGAAFHDKEKVMERIRSHQWGKAADSGLSQRQLERILWCVSELRKRDIEVLAFFPPWASGAREALYKSEEYGEAYRAYINEVPEKLLKEGIIVIDATDPSRFGFDDTCMIDGLHAMETFHVALLEELVRKSAALRRLVNVGDLQKMLQDVESNPWFPARRLDSQHFAVHH